MTINIPQSVFDVWNEFGNYFLENNNFSRICTLYFPPIKEVCTNCPTIDGESQNAFQHGGPAPFSFNSCTYCGGAGFREKEITDTIRLRTYWNSKNWIKTAGNIVVPDAEVQVIGKISDLSKFRNAVQIHLISEDKNLSLRFMITGEPFFHGFGKNYFFICYLKRA